MRRSISLRTYFSFILGLLTILMFIVLSITIGYQSIDKMKTEVGISLEETAIQMADKMDAFMWSRSGEIFTLSRLDALHDFDDPVSIQKLLEALKENFPAFSWIGLTDVKGTVIASTEGILAGVDISQRPVYMEGIKGPFIGDVHDAVLLAKLLPNPTGEAMKFVDVSLPVTEESGEVIGVLAAHLSWEWAYEIEQSVLEPLKKLNNCEMFVVSAKDNIILLGNSNMIGQKLTLSGLGQARQQTRYWSVETWEDDKQYLTGYALADGYMNYKGLDWTIVVRQPLKEAYASIQELLVFIIIIGILCSVLFSIIIWFIAGRISTPIKNISSAAEEIRSGKGVPIPLSTGIKEIELLSVSLRELVSSLIRHESALDKMDSIAHHDFLTGIPNRIGLERFLEKAISAALHNGETLLFLCLDLDGFKNANDAYGHHVGDIILQGVANRLNQYINEEELAARLGGDEFVVILQARTYQNFNRAQMIATDIISALNASFVVDGKSIHIGCSIGGAIWDASHSTQEILKLADEALYSSKRNGKNIVTFINFSV